MNRKSRRIAINAILIALMIIFTLLMKLNVAFIATAIIPLIVLVVGSQVEGWFTSIVLSTTFGLLSWAGAFMVPSPLAPIFQNPLVSVVPRIFIGWVGLAVYKLGLLIAKKCAKNGEVNKLAGLAVSAVAGGMTTIANTGLVLPMIWLLFGGKTVGSTAITPEFVTGLVTINFAIEIIGAILVPPMIVRVLSSFVAKGRLRAVTEKEIETATMASADDISVDDFFASADDCIGDNERAEKQEYSDDIADGKCDMTACANSASDRDNIDKYI